MSQRRSVPPEPVTVAGSRAEGSSVMRVVQAEVTGDRDRSGGTAYTAHRSSRSAEREARRKAKGKQRADYVSFMDVSYQAFLTRHNLVLTVNAVDGINKFKTPPHEFIWTH